MTFAASALLLPADALAKKGAPHTFTTQPNFSNVQLNWLNPTETKELKWHDNVDYDGDAGIQPTTQSAATIFIAAEFTPENLGMVKGDKIESLNYFEYRPVVGVTAIIWENGKIVRQQDADLATPAYKANQWRTIKFDEPYELTGDKTVRFGFKITHGSNMNFVAIMNKVANAKGDLLSYDGSKWYHNGRGTYLITANLVNEVDEAPDSYNVWIDGVKANAEPQTETAFMAADQTDGAHIYKIESVYASGESFFTPEAKVTVKGADSYFPPVAAAKVATNGVNGTISWEAPLLRTGNELTWSNKTYGNAIGGTASSNTKVWIKNEFTANDLLQFKGSKITAINAHFTTADVLSMTIFVMKDNVISHFETVPEETIQAIAENQWTKFAFAEPVEIETGHSYAYGYYILQTPKTKPVSVDTSTPISGKGNSFSTSSPSSKGFEQSSPSWKTLASGNIAGAWMLTADIEGGAASTTTVDSYTITRNGEKIAEGVKTSEYDDQVPAPGTYTYGIETVGSDGKTSATYTVKATYKLPEGYSAPLFSKVDFNKEDQTVALKWSMDKEMKHYGDITYKVGFDEDMDISFGARFTAAQLEPYEGYTIKNINFILGADIPEGFKLQIINGAGETLWSEEFPAGLITPFALYTYPVDKPVKITAQEDIYLAYSGNLKGGTSPIILDAGPLVDGGAMVKLAGMPSWLNLGTINSTYNNYNIVIGAVVSESETEATAEQKHIGAACLSNLPAINAKEAMEGYGVESFSHSAKAVAPRAVDPVSYNLYRNGVLQTSTAERTFTDELPGYDTYSYTVTAVYPNGLESAESDPVIIENFIRQAGPAPYDLTGEGKTLSWKAPDTAPVLTYAAPGKSFGVGMTGSGTRTTYAVNKFEPEALKDYEGKLITHIKFALYTTELKTAAVVIFKDFNIIYEQPVSVESLCAITDGYNDIRLNAPVAIEPNATYMIGYHITYANGIKPMIFDEGPAVNNYGNLLSASASHTSWKSLKSMSASMDGNWRIYATLANPTASAIRPKAEGLTYNIYLNGEQFKTGITTESYTHTEALPEGDYTVTAGEGETETAHSNVYRVQESGVDGIAADYASARYDAESQTLILSAGVTGVIVNAAGQQVATAKGTTSVAHLPQGVYIFVPADEASALRFVK